MKFISLKIEKKVTQKKIVAVGRSNAGMILTRLWFMPSLPEPVPVPLPEPEPLSEPVYDHCARACL